MQTDEFDLGYCASLGLPAGLDPCRENCEDTGTDYFSSYSLQNFPPGVSGAASSIV